MKRIFLIPLAILLVVGLLFGAFTNVAPVRAAPVKPIELTFAIGDPATNPDIKRGFKVWADELTKRTDGKVKITIHAGQTLAKASEQYDMVLKGAIDITKARRKDLWSPMPPHS